MAKETIGSTFKVIGGLCFACSLLVCLSVVALRPLQENSIRVDRQSSILEAAKIQVNGKVTDVFNQNIEPRLVDLATGEYLTEDVIKPLADKNNQSVADFVEGYNFVSASKLPESQEVIPADEDRAKLKVRAKYMPVYLIKNQSGSYSGIILPFYGQGLWSTMYGYLSLDVDGNTIKGVKYYSHGETPGLGAEITNPRWNEKWVNKKLYSNNSVAFEVKKNANGDFAVDALSGATLTSNGVTDSVKYWAGQNGYGKLLQKIQKEGVR